MATCRRVAKSRVKIAYLIAAVRFICELMCSDK